MRLRPVVLLLILLFLGACSKPQGLLLRLGDLLSAPQAPLRTLASEVTVEEPIEIPGPLDAAAVARLRLVARGTATSVRLAWRLEGETGYVYRRAVNFPLSADGAVHLYEVDLGQEPYWSGRVADLRLALRGGSLEVESLTALPPASPYRTMALGGLTLPALPGGRELVFRLPQDLPPRAAFEAHVGLLPEYDRKGVTAEVRAELRSGGERHSWLEERLQGDGASRWEALRRPVELRPGSEVVLSVEVRDGDHPLPPGVVFWGNPRLVAGPRPSGSHLLVVGIDTLRADVLGAYGDPRFLTPHLDALAAEGVRFADLSAPSPWTLPSFATLFTGLQPQTHGAGRVLGERFAPSGLPPEVTTLAEVLRGAGFATAAVYDNTFLGPSFGMHQGFDSYRSVAAPAEALVDRTLQLLRDQPDRRHFVFLHLMDPHSAYAPPPEECAAVAHRLAPGADPSWPCRADRGPKRPRPPEPQHRWIEALYLAEVAYVDRQVGRLLQGLDDLGLDGQTVVLVTSDHGEYFWRRRDQLRGRGYVENADHGHQLYQELLAVPGLLRGPGVEPAVVTSPVELADFFPTLLGLLGVPAPPCQGRDLRPLLVKNRPPGRLTLLADFLLYGPPRWTIRRGRWKLVARHGEEPAPELYDLDADPGEHHDLAAQREKVVAALLAAGRKELASRQAARERLVGDQAVAATFLEWSHVRQLKALGYLE